ncbi:MAG: hypothetical protein IJS58_02530 [Bacilli bacterium]|nr:hypothetical protein [Bacilli bacterium]
MQAIMETIFETIYLLFALFSGVYLLIKAKGRLAYILLGIAILVLGCGDAFHLVPRMVGLNTTGLENFKMELGLGKLMTSITMTFFYVIMYIFLIIRYKKNLPLWLHIAYNFLFLTRIILVSLPYNNWFDESPYIWNIIRNIPFVIMGIIFITMSFAYCKDDKYFKWMWLIVIFSFVFYLITALGASFVPILGLMMLPKTICYMLIFVFSLLSVNKEKSS